MKTLYVKRRIVDSFIKRIPKMLRQWYYFWGREGFFRASLHYHNQVKEISLSSLNSKTKDWVQNFDVIVFHFKCNHEKNAQGFEPLRKATKKLSHLEECPKALLLTNDSAGKVPDNQLLSWFDLIFKREKFKDLSKYESLNNLNRSKLRTTTLSCPIIQPNRYNFKRKNLKTNIRSKTINRSQNKVFFVGTATSKERIKIVRTLFNGNFDFHGGLQEKESKKYIIPEELKAERLPQKQFLEEIQNSTINLAIEGLGEFTYRHLELWCLGAFMISSPSLNELELPLNVKDGTHYVTYNSQNDLLEKIEYYLKHDEERMEIANNGRQAFLEGYDFDKHGQYIHKQLRSIL